MAKLSQIQETRETLESKAALYEGKAEADVDFRDTLLDYLYFYDRDVKPQLLDFAQRFKDTVASLTEFLGLQTSDMLHDTMASLLKYGAKHQVS